MAPLRHAVRFVDCEKRELIVVAQLIKQFKKTLGQQTLRRNVQKFDCASAQTALGLVGLLARELRVQKRCSNAEFMQRVDLILHQRDQRRNDDANAVAS